MIRLSFIVPFYNVEKYIEECIRSLYNQDIIQEEYEVICVDDCSPDGSQAIVERLQKEYPTLRLLIHKENKRQGGARNTGLKEAHGQYVWFVDSDDYIKPNCIKSLLEKAENSDLDILKFYQEPLPDRLRNRNLVSSSLVSGTDLIFGVNTGEKELEKCSTVWSQIVKRTLINKYKIKFAEKVQYEDDDYVYQLYAYAQRVQLVAFAPYVVRSTPDSTTRRRHDLRRVQDIYSQALRMVDLDFELTKQDPRWHVLITECINDCINNCVLRMLKGLSTSNQLHFWYIDRKQFWKLKPYLSQKAYVKLSSHLLWRLL